MTAFDDYFNNSTTARELFGLLINLDAEVHTGTYRQVFFGNADPKVVYKFETSACSFSNVIEHEVWDRIKDTEFAKWFAPVHHISPAGVILVMARTTPVKRHELPDKVPAFFTDLKPENWGRLGRRIVCHDYGANLLMENGMTKRMRKANWDK